MRNVVILGFVLIMAIGANGGGCSSGIVGVQDYGTVTGRVLDATTNLPIANAIISVGSLNTATADTKGAFTMGRIPVGQQTVTARSAGFTTASADIEVDKGETAQAGYIRLIPLAKPANTPTLQPPATPTPEPGPATEPPMTEPPDSGAPTATPGTAQPTTVTPAPAPSKIP